MPQEERRRWGNSSNVQKRPRHQARGGTHRYKTNIQTVETYVELTSFFESALAAAAERAAGKEARAACAPDQ
eukprot:9399577-Pyramimonas_sp.AAC.1